jgi:hypothetical protein
LPAVLRRASNTPMAEVKKIGRVTFRELTNEEALAKYGSSFVFVGQAKPATDARELLKEADAALEQLREMRKAKGAARP